MDTQALRWFQQVADGATLTEISDLEMVSQPGVSRALHRLEREVGTPLLRRSGRVLRLTAAGAVFKRHVDATMHSLDDGFAAVQQLLDPEHGIVTVAFEATLGTWLVPDLVGSFRHAHPGVEFDLRATRDEAAVARGDIDLELSTLAAATYDVEVSTLVSEPLRLIVPAGHRLAQRTSTPLVAAAAEPFIAIRESAALRRACDTLCRAAGVEPQTVLVADDLPTMRGYVAAGLGVAIVPTLWDDTAEPAGGRLRYLALTDDAATRSVVLSWSATRRMLDSAVLFRDHVLDRARTGRLPAPVDPRGAAPGSQRDR